MSTAELKDLLVQKIGQLEKNEILEHLLGIIELESSKAEPFIIPDLHQAGVEEGLEQIKAGKVKDHKDVISKYDSWDSK